MNLLMKSRNGQFASDADCFSVNRLLNILSTASEDYRDDAVEISIPDDSTCIDERVVFAVLANFRGCSVSVDFLGGINGTLPHRICLNGGSQEKTYLVPYQGLSAVNCTIGRPLRKRVFDSICASFPHLFECSFQDFIKILKSEEVRDICLTYGMLGKELFDIEACPSCQSTFSSPVTVGEGNAITGFLDASHDVYKFCNNCSLVSLSRQLADGDLSVLYTEDSYDRSKSKEEVLDSWKSLNEATTSHFGNYIVGLQNIKSDETVLDLGCGSGDFLSMVREAFPGASLTSVDFHIPDAIQNALSERDIDCKSANIVDYMNELNVPNKYDVVTMWEVIEHIKIDKFKSLLVALRKALKPGGRLVFSTPDFFDVHSLSLDFWAMAPGEHLYVYNLQVCETLLSQAGFEILDYEKESVTTKLAGRWYDYGSKTHSTLAGRAGAALVESFLLDQELREAFKETNRAEKVGSELIIIAGVKHGV
jgi:2-polyprenyl-3-methyl-5-hydroxy-6-metoxy-1,4-benzoquinol methylase